MRVQCSRCQTETFLSQEQFRCSCGGAWEQVFTTSFDPDHIDRHERGVWRYADLLEMEPSPRIDLGAGNTPLLPFSPDDPSIMCKAEYFAPTGSFKDRGSSVMINTLLGQKVSYIIEDSSGNAGASIAAYAARAGIRADIFAPASAPPIKKQQIIQFGARIIIVEGPRDEARKAAWAAVVGNSAVLAAHAYHPSFLSGMQTAAFEIWEQARGDIPEIIVTPIGQGLLFLGIWLGFKRIHEAGLIDRMPRMIGVQAASCSPVKAAIENHATDIAPIAVASAGPTLADGITVTAPVRGKRILQAIRETGGDVVTVTETQITEGQIRAAREGFLIENTSAVVIAALPEILQMRHEGERVLLMLTGTGLKNPTTSIGGEQ